MQPPVNDYDAVFSMRSIRSCRGYITRPEGSHIAFIATAITRQRYELSKQLQGLHIDVALRTET
jgi:hypothetical protein